MDVRPVSTQDEMESRRIWQPVTESIQNKDLGAATKHKQVIEQAQRDRAAERKKQGVECVVVRVGRTRLPSSHMRYDADSNRASSIRTLPRDDRH